MSARSPKRRMPKERATAKQTTAKRTGARSQVPAALPPPMPKFLDHIPGVAVQICDASGVVRYWSACGRDVFGCTSRAACGRKLVDLTVPRGYKGTFRALFKQAATASTAGRVLFDSELDMMHKDGNPVPVHCLCVTMPAGDSAAVLCVINRDLSRHRLDEQALTLAHEQLDLRTAERTKALASLNLDLEQQIRKREFGERALSESEARYQRMVEATTSYRYTVTLKDGKPCATRHGPGFERVTGYTPLDYASNMDLWLSMVHDKDRDAVRGAIAELMAGTEIPQVEHRIHHRDGSIRWVRVTLVPHRDDGGNLTNYDGLVEDITARKNAEIALQDSEERFRTVADYTYDWEMWHGKHGRVLYCSPSCKRIIGYTREEVMAGDITLQDCVKPEFKDAFTTAFDRALRGDTLEEEIFEIENRSGRERWISLSCSPVHTSKGVFKGCRSSVRNITERRVMETRMQNVQKLEAVGTLAGGIAHDFTNWLGIITGHAAALTENLMPKSRLHEEAAMILKTARHAGTLTKRLLTVARAGDSTAGFTISPVSLAEVVGDTVALVEAPFAQKGIRIDVKNVDDAPLILSNEQQLIDALMNLLMNSADALHDGGDIVIEASPEYVYEPPDGADLDPSSGPFLPLFVKDTGRGMPPQTLERIFTPFFTTKEGGTGTGLGLTMVQNVIRKCKGWIDCQSEQGLGTVFRIYLPIAAMLDEKRRKQRTRKETILVIDDDEQLLQTVSATLQHAGYRVHTAANGNEGLDVYRTDPDKIDLCIIDVIMPERDGRWVVKQLMELNPDARVVMLSGFSRDYIRGIIERGAWGFVQKPVEEDQLLKAVRKSLAPGPVKTA